jgi:hypothetical protein
MRFLRMLTNAVIAGALASAYLTILVLHLNPRFPLSGSAPIALAAVMGAAYGLNLAVLFYALIVMRQLAASEVLSPGWLSVRLLSWLCTMAAAGAAVIVWLNLHGFGDVLDPRIAERLTVTMLTLSASAVVFLLIALAHIGRRGGTFSAAVLLSMMAISVIAPLAARGWGDAVLPPARPNLPMSGRDTARADGRVLLVALDGATLDVISPAVAEGRLPNFGRIFDGGAVLHLATIRPTQPETVWSAAATGRAPAANGIRASALFRVRVHDPPLELLPDYCFAQALVRLGLLAETPHHAASLRAPAVWHILSDASVAVGVIGFPLTHPASPVHGFLVSDEFHRLQPSQLALDQESALSPPTLASELREALSAPTSPDPVALVAAVAETPQGDADARPDPAPILADRMHVQLLQALQGRGGTRFLAVRLPGLDAMGHYFLRYANPSAFGDVSEEEQRRYGRVLHEYYGLVDVVIGRLLDTLGPDDLLLVVSAFGMEPLSPGKRVLERLAGNPRISGTHERAPDGFLLAAGADVAAGRPARASILDLAPTILYYLGLPVGRDMEGFARTDLFRASFTASRPISFIPSYAR